MIYQLNERYEYVKYIEFKNTNPIQNVQQIVYFKEENISGSFVEKQYRYSFDKASWTAWNTLTQQNLSSIPFHEQPNFYIEIRYNRSSVIAGNILNFYIFYDSTTPADPSTYIDASIDADYLNGQAGSYYLNRDSHYGPYSALSVENVPDSSTYPGAYYGRIDTSIGTTILLKRLKSGSGISISESSNGIITIDASGSTSGIYSSTLDASLSMVQDVGGYDTGTTVNDLLGKTFTQMFDDLLFPTVNPTFTNPSNTFMSNQNSLQEVLNNLIIIFTAAFDAGDIYVGSTRQNDRSGQPNTYSYAGAGLISSISSSSLTNQQTVTSYNVALGYQTWSSNVSYDEGPQPYDSKGIIYSTPLPAASTTNKSVTIEGVYPIYGTTVIIDTLTKQTLVSMITGNNVQINFVSESGGNKQIFDIPVAWLSSRPLTTVQTYNTVSSQWETTGLSTWAISSTTHIINGNTINYTRYTYNGPDRGSVNIRLVF